MRRALVVVLALAALIAIPVLQAGLSPGSPSPYAADAQGSSTIQVIAGTYGSVCHMPRGNVTGHLAATCNGRQTCSYTIDYHVIGDPAYGCQKDYVAEWSCSNGGRGGTASASPEAGFGSIITLSCYGAAPVNNPPPPPPTRHQLRASLDCVPLSIRIGEMPGKSCTIWINGWNGDTASPVQLLLPQMVDGFGNHRNGIQITFGTTAGANAGVSPSNMRGFNGPDGSYGQYYPWGIFVLACPAQRGGGANCLPAFNTAPGGFSVPMVVHQEGSIDAPITLSGIATGTAARPPGNPGISGTLVRLQNRWKPDQYLHIEHGVLESGPIGQDWLSAQWEVQMVPGTQYFHLRNRWKPDQFINNQQGPAVATPAPDYWWSAMWERVPVPNVPGFYYIRNRWKPDLYLHIEHGHIECGNIQPYWWSAMWAM